MASLKDTEQLTQDLEGLVNDLRSELRNGKVDFERLVSIADEISEHADGLAETFSSVNDTLMERIRQVTGKVESVQKQASGAKAGSRG